MSETAMRHADYKLISADSHVSEPQDLWVERVDRVYRDRAPRLVLNPPGREGAYFLYEGYGGVLAGRDGVPELGDP